MIKLQGGLKEMMSTRGGAQESLLAEGVGKLVDGLADELAPQIRTGQRVTSIEQAATGLTVRTAAGAVRAIKAIVTVPPPMSRLIDFEPPSSRRIELERTTYMGSVYKAIGVYERPFWRERRSGGELIVLDEPGGGVFDTTPPGGPGHLCLLIGGREARSLDALDSDRRRAAVLGPLVPHLGREVLDPVSWHEKSWHLDPDVGGGYLALPTPGTTDGLLPMAAKPAGDIHWAGTETAGEHPGYIEGAIESGLRVAHEVLGAIGPVAGATLSSSEPAWRPDR